MKPTTPENERRFPVVALTLDEARLLLEPLAGPPPTELKLLSGGHVNTNYLVSREAEPPVVLRIWTAGEAAFWKETDLLKQLRPALPVPAVIFSAFERELLPLPYAALEWLSGEPLPLMLEAVDSASEALGEALGLTLREIARQKPPENLSLSFLERIQASLFRDGGAQYLGAECSARVWEFARANQALVSDLDLPFQMVHGDLQGDNILVRKQGSYWEVSGVLDWEWAVCGSPLQDLGSLLRYRGAASAGLASGLERALATDLPQQWHRVARLYDLAALCEKLAFPRHRGAVTEKAVALIHSYLSDSKRG